MTEAIVVLEKAEAVLMKRIRAMKDGSPKWSASNRLNELRSALKMIKAYEKAAVQIEAEQDEYIKEALILNPPIAQA
jgi:hypothetical protein